MNYIYHCERHPIYFMLVLSLVLAEGRMPLEQFVQHAAETEPIGGGIVTSALG